MCAWQFCHKVSLQYGADNKKIHRNHTSFINAYTDTHAYICMYVCMYVCVCVDK